CTHRSVGGQARSAYCPSRSIRRRANSPATSHRRSAISESSPAVSLWPGQEQVPDMIDKLAILGATGDLTARYLLPGLASLRALGAPGADSRLVAVGRNNGTEDVFRQGAAAQLDRHARELPAAAKQTVVATARYHQADVTDPASIATV